MALTLASGCWGTQVPRSHLDTSLLPFAGLRSGCQLSFPPPSQPPPVGNYVGAPREPVSAMGTGCPMGPLTSVLVFGLPASLRDPTVSSAGKAVVDPEARRHHTDMQASRTGGPGSRHREQHGCVLRPGTRDEAACPEPTAPDCRAHFGSWASLASASTSEESLRPLPPGITCHPSLLRQR